MGLLRRRVQEREVERCRLLAAHTRELCRRQGGSGVHSAARSFGQRFVIEADDSFPTRR